MMKKLLILAMAIAFGTSVSTNAQTAEVAPTIPSLPSTENTNALFDVVFNYDVGTQIGAQGNAGIVFVNNQFWVSAWAANLIHVLDAAGNFVETFSIPGVTGTRSMTYDGTSIFIGTASTTIYEINPATRSIEGTIIISPSTDATARMCAYDPTLDGGDGGFWTANFSSDIASFDMNGNELSVIPFGTHLQTIYGGAIDNTSPGGPFLWAHSQIGVTGDADRDQIVQLSLPSGAPTGVAYNYLGDAIPGTTEALAGGLYISDEVVSGGLTMIGLSQSTPSNAVFGLELIGSAGVNDFNTANFNIYPNPASGNVINIQTGVSGEKLVTVYDVLGKQVIHTTIFDSELNISSLKAGVYMVSVTQNKATVTKKLVVQ